jgi:hypothetical protein
LFGRQIDSFNLESFNFLPADAKRLASRLLYQALPFCSLDLLRSD